MGCNKDIEIVDKQGKRTVVTLEEIEMRLLAYLSRGELKAFLVAMESAM
jgi:hypothetical protein